MFVKEKKRIYDIAKVVKFSPTAVRQALKKEGVYEKRSLSLTHRTYTVDETAFDTINDESAYWIGFFMADGYILERGNKTPYRIGVGLHEQDTDHLYKLKKFLNASHPLHRKPIKSKANNTFSYSLIINSEPLVRALKKYGVVPRKSLNACVSPSLENNPHFWRGVVDGDGALFMDKHNTPYFNLIGAKKLMGQFMHFITSQITYTPYLEPHKKSDVLVIRLCGEGAKQIAKILYKNAPVALKRKHEMALLFEKTKIYRVFGEQARKNIGTAAKKAWVKRKQKETK